MTAQSQNIIGQAADEMVLFDAAQMQAGIVGAKAANLAAMQNDGLLVPEFFCLTTAAMQYALAKSAVHLEQTLQEFQTGKIGSAQAAKDIAAALSALEMPADLQEQIYSASQRLQAPGQIFSVRSSALPEDGISHSYAGQYHSSLDVRPNDLSAAVIRCWRSAFSARLLDYQQGISSDALNPADMFIGVVIQTMVAAEVSGVLFSANPLGLLNESVISCGYGSGAGTLLDEQPLTSYYYNLSDELMCSQMPDGAPQLNTAQIQELVELGQAQEEKCGHPVDIEWALQGGKIYVLQRRPITALGGVHDSVVLDNSNIVESYPGVSAPLTRSFVKQVYHGVFCSLAARCLATRKVADGYDDVFQEMVAGCNGRLYYQISNWYFVLRFVPMQKRVIPIWQRMMGVKSAFGGNSGLNPAPLWQRVVTWAKIAGNLLTVPGKMIKLNHKFSQIESEFYTRLQQGSNSLQLLELYDLLAKRLLKHWDVTLINDMYAFLFTALVQRQIKKQGEQDWQSAAAELLGSVAGIESMKPMQSLLALAMQALANEAVHAALTNMQSDADVWEFLRENCGDGELDGYSAFSSRVDDQDHNCSDSNQADGQSRDGSDSSRGDSQNRSGRSDFATALLAHLRLYGDRGLEELKLESQSWREYPFGLVGQILNYTANPDHLRTVYSALHTTQAANPKGVILRFALRRAKNGIYHREISRLNRSRIFGMVRRIMLDIGTEMQNAGVLEKQRDIFMLNLHEITEYAHRNGSPASYKALVYERQQQQLAFAKLPAYSHLVFANMVFDRFLDVSIKDMQVEATVLMGSACSEGVARAEALRVDNPMRLGDVSGKILVTKTTDPGWVFLLGRAAGVIAEKGSLLSHTAIIARELGVPMVVGIERVNETLKTGDYVLMDGGTGRIEVLHGAEPK